MKVRTVLVAMTSLLFAVSACQSTKKAEKTSEHPGEKASEHPGEEAQEHPGEEHHEHSEEGHKEHPGEGHEEHPGDGKKEHPGEGQKEHPGDKKMKKVTASDIKSAIRNHIKKRTKEGTKGAFTIKDSKAGKKLELKFVKIHEPVRKMKGKGYFACTDFHVKGEKDKIYDLDFWLKSKKKGLAVTKEKIHKHPVKQDGEWVKKARYTFKGDKIVEVQ